MRRTRAGPRVEVVLAHLAPWVPQHGHGSRRGGRRGRRERRVERQQGGDRRGALAASGPRRRERGAHRRRLRRHPRPVRVGARASGQRSAGGRHVAQRSQVDAAADVRRRVRVCHVNAYVVRDGAGTSRLIRAQSGTLRVPVGLAALLSSGGALCV